MRQRIIRKSKVAGGMKSSYLKWCAKKGIDSPRPENSRSSPDHIEIMNRPSVVGHKKTMSNGERTASSVSPLFSPLQWQEPEPTILPEFYRSMPVTAPAQRTNSKIPLIGKTIVTRWEAPEIIEISALAEQPQTQENTSSGQESEDIVWLSSPMKQAINPGAVAKEQQDDDIIWLAPPPKRPRTDEFNQSGPISNAPTRTLIPHEVYKKKVAKKTGRCRAHEKANMIYCLDRLLDASGEDEFKFGELVKMLIKRFEWHAPMIYVGHRDHQSTVRRPPAAPGVPRQQSSGASSLPSQPPVAKVVPKVASPTIANIRPRVQAASTKSRPANDPWMKMITKGIELLEEGCTIAYESNKPQLYRGKAKSLCEAHAKYVTNETDEMSIEPIPDEIHRQMGLVQLDSQTLIDLDLSVPNFILLHRSLLKAKADGFSVACFSQVTRNADSDRLPYFKCYVANQKKVRAHNQNIRICPHLKQLAFFIAKPPCV